MTGGSSNGGAAIVLWAVVVAGVGIPAMILAGKACARWRAYLPERFRLWFGYPLEGDLVECPHCDGEAVAEAWPDDRGADGIALFCGGCGAVLDYGGGMAAMPVES